MKQIKRDCSAQAYDSSGFGNYYPCSKTAKVKRDGEWYCTIHDPAYIKAKDAERRAKYDKETRERRARWDLDDARHDATKGLTLEELRRVTPELIRQALIGRQVNE